MGFTKLAFKGISWMGVLRVFTRLLSLAKTAVLARVLTPFQFGVYGIGTLALGFLEMMTETGINIFLIQEKEDIDRYISSAWFVSILRGILIGLVIFLLSPVIASFFKSGSAVDILRLISIVPIIRGFINPAVVKFQKNLEFNKQFFYDSSLFLIDTTVAIVLGLILKSETALVWGMITAALFEVVLSFKIFSPIPKFVFDKEKTLKVINRGKWITGAGIFNYLFQNMDNIFIGRMLGTTILGFYQQAYRISTVPVSEVGEVFNKVTFPIYASIDEDKQRLKKAFLKTLVIIVLLVVPFGALVFYFPYQIVNIIFGPTWLPMTPLLQILAIFGVVKAISNSFFSLFLGLRKQEVVTLVTFISSIVLFALLFPLIKIFGAIGAGYAVIIATMLAFPVTLYYFFKLLK